MRINKITNGFVSQLFDTEKRQFVSQEFVAGDVSYEDAYGDTVSDPIRHDAMLNPDGSELNLPLNMVQPDAATNLASCREQIQEDLLCLFDGMSSDVQNRMCQIIVDNFQKFLK